MNIDIIKASPHLLSRKISEVTKQVIVEMYNQLSSLCNEVSIIKNNISPRLSKVEQQQAIINSDQQLFMSKVQEHVQFYLSTQHKFLNDFQAVVNELELKAQVEEDEPPTPEIIWVKQAIDKVDSILRTNDKLSNRQRNCLQTIRGTLKAYQTLT
jgi:hypothetical protein